MTDKRTTAERLNDLEERMGRLEGRMIALSNSVERLRKDLDGHFDRLIKLLEERLPENPNRIKEGEPMDIRELGIGVADESD